MKKLTDAVDHVLEAQRRTRKPLAIIVAGHNGSGKSTMWRKLLSNQLQIPLLNADRMMLSVLPEADTSGALIDWAQDLRDGDLGWMQVAQQGVGAFAAHAMQAKVSFAIETVFSHWDEQADGSVRSKLDVITDLQAAGYFVLLFFVGLANVELSILRVETRVAEHGHAVPLEKLLARFPRTQRAIGAAASIADATIFVDNSRERRLAFTVCRVQLGARELFDLRSGEQTAPPVIREWLDKVSPLP